MSQESARVEGNLEALTDTFFSFAVTRGKDVMDVMCQPKVVPFYLHIHFILIWSHSLAREMEAMEA